MLFRSSSQDKTKAHSGQIERDMNLARKRKRNSQGRSSRPNVTSLNYQHDAWEEIQPDRITILLDYMSCESFDLTLFIKQNQDNNMKMLMDVIKLFSAFHVQTFTTRKLAIGGRCCCGAPSLPCATDNILWRMLGDAPQKI